jgi:peptide/nickel transport system substrate-binding protein
MDVLKLKDDPRFAVYQYANPSVYITILWNHRHPFFSDPVIRRALTLAINRRELHQALSIPETVPIFDVTFSERQFWLDEIPAPLPFNPKQASQLLEEAGWHDIDGDGIRERDGEEFRFSMLVSHRAFIGEKPAVYIQEQLRRVGIRIEITKLFSMLLYKKHMEGDFDSAIYMFYNFPGNTLSYSAIGYDNPRIFQLHRTAGKTMDLDKLDNVYRELMAIHRDEIPVTFLYPYLYSIVARKSIRGLSSPFRVDPVIDMEHLWINKEK